MSEKSCVCEVINSINVGYEPSPECFGCQEEEREEDNMSEKKTYVFRFDVVESWKASFEAESDKEAGRLFAQVIDGDINPNELPGYFEKNSGIDTDYESYGLEDAAGKRIFIEFIEREDKPND